MLLFQTVFGARLGEFQRSLAPLQDDLGSALDALSALEFARGLDASEYRDRAIGNLEKRYLQHVTIFWQTWDTGFGKEQHLRRWQSYFGSFLQSPS